MTQLIRFEFLLSLGSVRSRTPRTPWGKMGSAHWCTEWCQWRSIRSIPTFP